MELQRSIMKHFFVKHEHIAVLIQWEANTSIFFRLKREKLIYELEQQCKIIYNIQQNKKDVDMRFNTFRKQIVGDVYTRFLDLKERGQSFTNKHFLETCFQSLWNQWRSRIEVEKIPNQDVTKDLQRIILESPIMNQLSVFPTKTDLISDTLRYETIGELDFERLSNLRPPKLANPHYYSLNNLAKKNTFRAFFKTIFLRNSKEKGSKQFLCLLDILKQECERSTQEYLADLNAKQCSYDPNSFLVVIKNCHEILTKYNAKQSNNIQQSLELTTDFFFDFIFHQCCRSIPRFRQIEDEFISRTSLDSKFINLEIELREIFFKLCDGIQSEYLSATQLASITIKGMKDYLRDSVVNKFRSQFENDPSHATTYQSRYSLILHILKDLARNKNFADYIS